MNLLRVSYRITLGNITDESGDRSRLLELHSDASLAIPVNRCRLVLADSPQRAIAPGDPVTVQLGYDRRLEPIFTGRVHAVRRGIDRFSVEARGRFSALTRARFNLLYEKSTAGDIVRDIAVNRLDLEVRTVESGLRFLTHALGDHQTAYEHIAELAGRCGFDFYADPSDKLVFADYRPGEGATFTYGLNLLDYVATAPTEGARGVEIYGESPAGQGQGESAGSWLTKKEVKGTAGESGKLVSRRFEATARTQAIAGQMAKALLDRQTPKQSGVIRGLGDPGAGLGRSVTLLDLPAGEGNGTFKAIAVSHRLDRSRGFQTTVHWEKT